MSRKDVLLRRTNIKKKKKKKVITLVAKNVNSENVVKIILNSKYSECLKYKIFENIQICENDEDLHVPRAVVTTVKAVTVTAAGATEASSATSAGAMGTAEAMVAAVVMVMATSAADLEEDPEDQEDPEEDPGQQQYCLNSSMAVEQI